MTDNAGGKPGFLARRHLAKEAKLQAKAAAVAAAHQEEIDRQIGVFQARLDIVTGFKPADDMGDGPVLRKGEVGVVTLNGVGLMEMKRAAGHYSSGYGGASYNLGDGIRVHTGRTRGHYVPGPEQHTVIDEGALYLTNQRALFAGARQSREWKFDNLVARHLAGNQSTAWIELSVSNRQKVSAFSFPAGKAEFMDFMLDLAFAVRSDDLQGLADEMRAEISKRQTHAPA